MKWLSRTNEFRRKEFKKIRSEIHDEISETIEKKSPECAVAARLAFGGLARGVCTLSSFSAVAYS
jgi:hypothetical protein